MAEENNTNGAGRGNAGNGQDAGKAPLRTLRDGALSSSIWERRAEDGETFMTAEVVRNYRDQDGDWHKTSSFSESDLRRLPDLARNTSDVMTALRHDQQLVRDMTMQRQLDIEDAARVQSQTLQAPEQTAPGFNAQKVAYTQKRKAQVETAPTQKQRIKNKPAA